MDAARHLYVHVPYCDGKCLYCGFYSEPYHPAGADRYLDALDEEVRRHAARHGLCAPETIYVGGGTPSVLSAPQLERLCGIVARHADLRGVREWTVEGNPGTFTAERTRVLRQGGATRVSLGVQSFRDRTLAAWGRRHTAADVARTLAGLRSAGFRNIGLDLIAALPGVSDPQWRETLHRTVALDPGHVSVYALTVEPRSALAARLRARRDTRRRRTPGRGRPLPDDERTLRALQTAEHVLGDAGFERYEISNYARTGTRCRHNESFWRGEDYLGFGPAAASRSGLRRWTNAPDLAGYVEALTAGREPPRDAEDLTPAADQAERLAFGFRLREGVDVAGFCRRFGVSGARRRSWERLLAGLADGGLVCRAGDRWVLTLYGRDMADYVARELMDA